MWTICDQRIRLGWIVLVNCAGHGDNIGRMDLIYTCKASTGHDSGDCAPPVFNDVIADIIGTKAAVQACINAGGHTANTAKETVRNITQRL
jgi:hypothetical protein